MDGDRLFKESADTDYVDNANQYGYTKKKVHMTPDEFMIRAERTGTATLGMGKVPLKKYEKMVIHPSRVQYYVHMMKKGVKAPAVHLEYDSNGKIFGHDGRHRVLAAKILGARMVPVWIIKKREFMNLGKIIPMNYGVRK